MPGESADRLGQAGDRGVARRIDVKQFACGRLAFVLPERGAQELELLPGLRQGKPLVTDKAHEGNQLPLRIETDVKRSVFFHGTNGRRG